MYAAFCVLVVTKKFYIDYIKHTTMCFILFYFYHCINTSSNEIYLFALYFNDVLIGRDLGKISFKRFKVFKINIKLIKTNVE